jgi:hypothetical protein
VKSDGKRKGTGPMPPVLKKLGPGVVLRPKKEEDPLAPKQPETPPEYTPSDLVFRRKK